jgi:hypothetical protein
MTDLRKAAEMALDALESWQKTCLDCGRGSEELGRATKPIKALRDRLAQPEPEPVAWFQVEKDADGTNRYIQVDEIDAEFYVPLYTAPPKREWVSIPDWEIHEMYNEPRSDAEMIAFAREFEAKLKEKNCG